MRHKYLIFVLLSFLAACKHKPDIEGIYRFAIKNIEPDFDSLNIKYKERSSEEGKFYIGKISPINEEYYKTLKANKDYKAISVIDADLQNLKIRKNTYDESGKFSKVVISDELLYSNDGKYVLYYYYDFGAEWIYYKISIKYTNEKYHLVRIEYEGTSIE